MTLEELRNTIAESSSGHAKRDVLACINAAIRERDTLRAKIAACTVHIDELSDECVALRKRIEEATLAGVYFSATRIPSGHINKLPAFLCGKRVRLVMEDGE